MADKAQRQNENGQEPEQDNATKPTEMDINEVLDGLEGELNNETGLDLDFDLGAGPEAELDSQLDMDPLAALVGDLKEVHAQKDELQDQLMRNAAEMENLRKRTRREVADARTFAIAGFARDLLSVSDNLRRAIDAMPQEEIDADTGGLKTMVEGVTMTERELISTLDKHGVKRIEPYDKKFNPNFHQAMFEVPNPEVANNTIVEVVQPGFVIGERVLRPAMVGVAKGGPKMAAVPEESDELDDPSSTE